MSSLSLITLNCWGLKYIAKDRSQRIHAIGLALASSHHDIVLLQELWVTADFEHVKACVKQRLPFSKFFYSGALGSGLAIFSRFPIVSTLTNPYSLCGHPADLSGDWFVGKAAVSAVLRHPVLDEIEVFNTHLYSKGGETGPEYYRAHRLVNTWELAKLVRQSASLGRYVIVAGDFNSTPASVPISVIKGFGGLTDAWLEVQRRNAQSIISLSSPPENLTPEDAISIYGVTADSPLCSYSAGKPLDQFARKFFGKRLDYILYRQPSRYGSQENPVLICSQSQVKFTEQVPGHLFSHSDHFGLEATFEINEPLGERQNHPPVGLSDELLATVINALTTCYRLSLERSRKELLFFVISILSLLALTIGTAWTPVSWINPVYILVTIVISWFGTTVLYTGFIYGNWERKALMTAIEDLEMHKRNSVMSRSSSLRSSP